MKKVITLLLTILLLCSCGNKNNNLSLSLDVTEDTKFDGIYVTITIEDFINKGFEYGDSVDVLFSNGLEFKDLPFYSGYYVKRGEPLVVGYKGYPYVEVTRSSNGLWKESKLNEGDSAVITLNTKGKYKVEEETFSLKYSDELSDYDSKEKFANYRAINGGNLRSNYLYRGASPIDNNRNRPLVVNELLKNDSIKFIIDLADNEEDYNNGIKDAYVNELYDNGSIILLDMSANYDGKEYKEAVANIVRKINEDKGPYYIHCLEGKDRTGFVCFVIESLLDFSLEELEKDYMITFNNYFDINKESSKERYDAIKALNFDSFVEYLTNSDSSASVKDGARNYLLSTGLNDSEIDSFIKVLSK